MSLPPASGGLAPSDFRQIACNGWGDSFNAYAYSMAWFDDSLYVGNSRGNLVMIHRHHPDWMRVWPVRTPRNFHDFDFRAQIWRYRPRDDHWERVYRSPWVDGRNREQVPRDIGYRSMTLFKPARERREALYATAFSAASSGQAPRILRCRDGINFDSLPATGSDPTLNTYRILQMFGGRLYTSPTGRAGGAANASGSAVILETGDPASEPWRPVSELGFGHPGNQTFFEMASFNDYLYVGTLNPRTGFQIWKTPGGRKPWRWRRVMTNGAYRGNLNEIAISMCVFNGALYVGTGIQNGGYDRTHRVGPAAPELIRIFPDDSWDLIVGTTRTTPCGWKSPLSGWGPGFSNPFNGYFWRMAVHDGSLYLGTYKWVVMLPWLKGDKWPAWLQRAGHRLGIDELAYSAGGFDLWRSPNGVDWGPITRNGFNNPYNYGVRTLQTTPCGLFVGTANPFGPDVAVRTGESWQYHPNRKGGLEIWLGSKTHGNSLMQRHDGR
jgi:hypothetical protein